MKNYDDDKKEDATSGQHTDNDHPARKQADNSQPDDHGRLVEELLQPDEQLVSDLKIDTGILCTAAELEMIDNKVQTDLEANGRKIETPNQQAYSVNYAVEVTDINDDKKDDLNTLQTKSGSTEWKKEECSRILTSGNMVSTAQMHFLFKKGVCQSSLPLRHYPWTSF